MGPRLPNPISPFCIDLFLSLEICILILAGEPQKRLHASQIITIITIMIIIFVK